MSLVQRGRWLRRWRRRRATVTEDSAEADLGPVAKVSLLGLPLQLHARSQQLHDDLFREFALITSAEGDTVGTIPGRLLRLAEELDARYLPANPAGQVLEEAARDSREKVDVHLRVPLAVADPIAQFDALLDEADEYCRRGGLLTLAFPPEVTAFRRWVLSQHVDQLKGEPPVSWERWRASLRNTSSA